MAVALVVAAATMTMTTTSNRKMCAYCLASLFFTIMCKLKIQYFILMEWSSRDERETIFGVTGETHSQDHTTGQLRTVDLLAVLALIGWETMTLAIVWPSRRCRSIIIIIIIRVVWMNRVPALKHPLATIIKWSSAVSMSLQFCAAKIQSAGQMGDGEM